ncbi:hypothetical protein [Fimbriimonas ginsengisoli]|uniref:Uncharacterized protein n=1 Tax=Fimbriimonas ginsengisoli Gsoil 348 TaxID=661478 RepID=A0A068NLZ5_FIMGI|nr:hypothetical protein [Fimbriimonas ginsengisoli]AIE84496.1 hypothetical protein OP10G_1128 [Fimbriimonas ginsengisoli Gsoil 348]
MLKKNQRVIRTSDKKEFKANGDSRITHMDEDGREWQETEYRAVAEDGSVVWVGESSLAKFKVLE